MLNENEHSEITARDVVQHLTQSVRMAVAGWRLARRKLLQYGALSNEDAETARKAMALLEKQIGLADDYYNLRCDGINLAKALELNAQQLEKLMGAKK